MQKKNTFKYKFKIKYIYLLTRFAYILPSFLPYLHTYLLTYCLLTTVFTHTCYVEVQCL